MEVEESILSSKEPVFDSIKACVITMKGIWLSDRK